jgi:hypothetical protein
MKNTDKDKATPLTTDLRQTLKEMMQRELENLPTLLEGLEPKERITILCRIMPFVLPKVNSVHPSEGERFTGLW